MRVGGRWSRLDWACGGWKRRCGRGRVMHWACGLDCISIGALSCFRVWRFTGGVAFAFGGG